MATLIYQCPTTGYRVQGWLADKGTEDRSESYEQLTCLACRQVHFVNPKTGKVLDQGPFRMCTRK
jgi:hypothetical protein